MHVICYFLLENLNHVQPISHSVSFEPELVEPFDCSLVVGGQSQFHLARFDIHGLTKHCGVPHFEQVLRKFVIGLCTIFGVEPDIRLHPRFLLEGHDIVKPGGIDSELFDTLQVTIVDYIVQMLVQMRE